MDNVKLLPYTGPAQDCILCAAPVAIWFTYDDAFTNQSVKRPTCRYHGETYLHHWQRQNELELTKSASRTSSKQKRVDDKQPSQVAMKPVFGQSDMIIKPKRSKKVA